MEFTNLTNFDVDDLEFPIYFYFYDNPNTIIIRSKNKFKMIDLTKYKYDQKLREQVIELTNKIRDMSFILYEPFFQSSFRVQTYGPDDGLKIVMVGGFPDDSVTWRYQIKKLTELGLKCIVMSQPKYTRYFGEWNSDQCYEYFEITLKNILKPKEKIITMSHDLGCFWMSRFNTKYKEHCFKNIIVQYGDMGYKNHLKISLWNLFKRTYEEKSFENTMRAIQKLDRDNIHSGIFSKTGTYYNITWRMCIIFKNLFEGKLTQPDKPIPGSLFVVGRQNGINYYTSKFLKNEGMVFKQVEASHWPHIEKARHFNKILVNYLKC